MQRHKLIGYLLLAVVLLAALVACRDRKAATKGNFETAINDYYKGHQECMVFFPNVQLSGSQVLADAGLLTKTTQTEKAFWGGMTTSTKYEISPEGQKYHDAHGRLCYGRAEVAEIVNFTEPGDMMGQKVSRVMVKYRIVDLAPWAKLDSVQKTFPEIKKAAAAESSPLQREMVLVLMNDGWSVPNQEGF